MDIISQVNREQGIDTALSTTSSKRTPEEKLAKFRAALQNIDESKYIIWLQNQKFYDSYVAKNLTIKYIGSSGFVKKELFINLMECMNFQLDLKSEQALTTDNYACRGTKINYQEVLDNLVLKRNGANYGTWSIK